MFGFGPTGVTDGIGIRNSCKEKDLSAIEYRAKKKQRGMFNARLCWYAED